MAHDWIYVWGEWKCSLKHKIQKYKYKLNLSQKLLDQVRKAVYSSVLGDSSKT